MPYREFTREELVRLCADLQQSASRAISIKQELIATRDALERELSRYRQIQRYIDRVLPITTIEEFGTITAETLVETYEVEAAMLLCFNVNEDKSTSRILGSCGIVDCPPNVRFEPEWTSHSETRLHQSGSPLIDAWSHMQVHDALVFPLHNAEGKPHGCLVALRTEQGATFYPDLPTDSDSSVGVLAQQVNALLRNFLAKEVIRESLILAEAATKTRTEFLANMSHEIRTPMNGVIGMTGLLLDTHLDATQKSFVETIRNSGNHLLSIINDILDFSKLEAKKLEMERYPFDVRECFDEAIEIVAAGMRDKPVELVVDIDSTVPERIMGDAGRIRQVLVNLVGNAMKFTAVGHVLVHVRAMPISDDIVRLIVTVQDTGIGIAPDKIERLFKPFAQADASTNRSHGGTGLGLAICKQIVEASGGSIEVSSTLGRGSAFTFEIPAPMASTSNESTHPTPNFSGKTALVVDDNRASREALQSPLQLLKMQTILAESGSHALELAQQVPFDLAIIDFAMPEMNGIELARALRSIPDRPPIPCILLGSQGNLDTHSENLFVNRLSKPVRQSTLVQQVAEFFQASPAKQASAPTAHLDEHERLRPLRILLAEDNAINQRVAVLFLQKLGYRADVVSNGREAVLTTERVPYDIIFMDVQMPEMDGLEATRQILARSLPFPHPQIIAMTAHAIAGDRERCLAAGMVDYLNKPIELPMLRSALLRAAARLRQQSPSATTPIAANSSPDKLIFNEERALSLHQLGELTGTQVLAELRQAFDHEYAQSLANMRHALSKSDAKTLERIAHSFKSTCGNLGGERIAAVCQQIEDDAKEESLGNINELLARLDVEATPFLAALDTLLKSLG